MKYRSWAIGPALVVSALLLSLSALRGEPSLPRAEAGPPAATLASASPLTATGPAYGWGSNFYGELGNGSTTWSSTPVVAGLPVGVTATAIAAGIYHSLAIGSDGKAYAWGYNYYGQLGNGSTSASNVPVVVSLPNGASATAIAARSDHSLAIGSDGKLYAWGYNNYGQLGNGTTASSSTPVVASLPSGVSATGIAAGGSHSLAMGSDGKLYAWGYNASGQLGNGTTINSSAPVTVSLPSGVSATAIAAGRYHSLAKGSDGRLYAWGESGQGQVGNGGWIGFSRTPVVVSLPSGVSATAFAGGDYHSVASGSDGKVYAWGAGQSGQLGNGNTGQINAPAQVSLPSGVSATTVAAGGTHNLAVGSDAKVYAWGSNILGELGNGSTVQANTPVVVSLPNGVSATALAAGGNHSLAIGSGAPWTATATSTRTATATATPTVTSTPTATATGGPAPTPTAPSSLTPSVFLAVLGGPGSGDLNLPRGIAMSRAGVLYVVDSGNNRVETFDASGTYLSQWGSAGSGPGQFSGPAGIALDASGNVYVIDRGNSRVQKFDRNGSYLAQWGSNGSGPGQLSFPDAASVPFQGIAVDGSGNVYVADGGNNRVQKFDGSGTWLGGWGSAGTGSGQLSGPAGVAVDASGNVYVADGGNNRVQKFDGSGRYLAQWGTLGSGDGQLSRPGGVAVDRRGNIAVADSGNNRVQTFDPSGRYLAQWGSAGAKAGQFAAPDDLTFDLAGNAYVADTGNHRVQFFARPTMFWTIRPSMPTARSALGVAAAGNGKIYAIGGVDSSGNSLAAVEAYDPTSDTWTTGRAMPTARHSLGLAAAGNGKLYAIGGCCGIDGAPLATVEEYDPGIDQWIRRADLPTARQNLGVAVAQNGRLFVAGGCCDADGNPLSTVEEYDPASDGWTARSSLSWARDGLALVPAGNGKLYAIGGRYDEPIGTVEEYDPGIDSWRDRAEMPTARFGAQAARSGVGTLYVLGGSDAAGPVATVEEYDPAADQWARRIALPTGRAELGAVLAAGGQVYAIGGRDGNDQGLGTVEAANLSGYQLFLPSVVKGFSATAATSLAERWTPQVAGAPAGIRGQTAGCPALPSDALADPLAQFLVAQASQNPPGSPVVWPSDRPDLFVATDPAVVAKLTRLRQLYDNLGRALPAGWTVTLESTYRPQEYQDYLRGIVDALTAAKAAWPGVQGGVASWKIACPELAAAGQRYGLAPGQVIARISDHRSGLAFDASVFDSSGNRVNPKRIAIPLALSPQLVQLRALACDAGLALGDPYGDGVHFRVDNSAASAGPCPGGRTSLRATPVKVQIGAGVTVSWTNIATPSLGNRIGVHRPGDPPDVGSALALQSIGASSAGSAAFTAGTWPLLSAGPYLFRLFDQNNVRLAVSNPILVVPSPPTGLTASKGIYPDKVRVTWQPVPGATFYKLYRDASSRPFVETPGTSVDDTGALPGITYSYRVAATVRLALGSVVEVDTTASGSDTGWVRLPPTATPTRTATATATPTATTTTGANISAGFAGNWSGQFTGTSSDVITYGGQVYGNCSESVSGPIWIDITNQGAGSWGISMDSRSSMIVADPGSCWTYFFTFSYSGVVAGGGDMLVLNFTRQGSQTETFSLTMTLTGANTAQGTLSYTHTGHASPYDEAGQSNLSFNLNRS